MTVAAVFLSRECGIYLFSYLCVAVKKVRCACVHLYTHRHAWMFINTVTHTQRTVLENSLPLFPIISTELIHPRLCLTWNLTEDLGHSVQICFHVPKNFKPNQPKPLQALIPNLEILRNSAAPSRNNLDLHHGKTPWLLGLSTHFTAQGR